MYLRADRTIQLTSSPATYAVTVGEDSEHLLAQMPRLWPCAQTSNQSWAALSMPVITKLVMHTEEAPMEQMAAMQRVVNPKTERLPRTAVEFAAVDASILQTEPSTREAMVATPTGAPTCLAEL